jgi:hypothetical protein
MTKPEPSSDRRPPATQGALPSAVLSPLLRRDESVPRRDLAGCRMRTPASASIYLIDPDGYRRWVPNRLTYDRLFRDREGIADDLALDQIAQRPRITSAAMLVRGDESDSLYLLERGVKRLIPSPAVMDKYHFSWDRVFAVKQFLIEKIPHGRNWD